MPCKAVKHREITSEYRVPVALISIHFHALFFHLGHQDSVVQMLDSTIHRINHYPADKLH